MVHAQQTYAFCEPINVLRKLLFIPSALLQLDIFLIDHVNVLTCELKICFVFTLRTIKLLVNVFYCNKITKMVDLILD